MLKIEQAILSIFHDTSNRPKITPRHEAAIKVMLENDYSPRQIQNSLNKLEKDEKLHSLRYKISKVGFSKFYFLTEFNNEKFHAKLQKKVTSYASWIEKYASKKVTDMLGEHLHDLVKVELRAQNFEITDEKNVHEYKGKKWMYKHSLDIVAHHKQKNLTIGVEVKNALHLTPVNEIKIKIDMCDYFGITPVFACRWMESHRNLIEKNNGFLWQFKHQLYPRGQDDFVNIIRKRFKFPVLVSGELPRISRNEFSRFINKIN